MVQLRTQRTALVLYGVLLVLPTIVLGGLQWHQIVQEKEDELSAVPRHAEDGARRFRDMAVGVVERLVEQESRRPFEHYAELYYPSSNRGIDMPLMPSPLGNEARPAGLVCWFSAEISDEDEADIDLYWGESWEDGREDYDMYLATESLVQSDRGNQRLRRLMRLGEYREQEVPLRSLAVNRASHDDRECLRRLSGEVTGEFDEILASEFELKFFRDGAGEPRLAATRQVVWEGKPEWRGLSECLVKVSGGLALIQGFFVDLDWLFGELPESIARNVLDPAQHFVQGGQRCCEGREEYHASVRLMDALQIEVERDTDRDFGLMHVAVDTEDVEARFRRRSQRFFGVAGMLALSLGTGMVLLLRSVQKDLHQAERTENFVNAVTHELRTPLSAIRLHSEMLLDGWVSDPEKQKTYYRRIVRETDRLSTMVERVLEKARLAAGTTQPFPGDLETALAQIEPELSRWDDREFEDVTFEVEPELPKVMMTQEAISSIVVNLVENARKYAPVNPDDPGAEPIRVVASRNRKGRVQLDVRDRGPGLSLEDREHVFDAFFRVGNEATRTSRGTGLGLHLVAMQADAIGGRAEVQARDGGGSIFRVTLANAPDEA